ncbi:MAG: leucyl/phenylalanyl-tRNA--protein transferase [Saprospiraceae bacterium]|nr:leucyl/phenylalanyl-tRNA--protein transferase [Saprospiraceae bacterium]
MVFPHPLAAGKEGLLAIGGDLSSTRLLMAYHFGIFPWYQEGEDILWWSPDPRCVLYPKDLIIHKSMRSVLRKKPYQVTFNREFAQVIKHCKETTRAGQHGTWITSYMVDAYIKLHHLGYAHSVEVWSGKDLVGGLYGILLGNMFFGESMFSLLPNTSKYGFIHFVQQLENKGCWLIDCQQDTPHLRSLGASLISREQFQQVLRKNLLVLLED